MVKFVHLCLHAVIFIFCFSDRRSLKIEDENNSTETDHRSPIYRSRVPRVQFINTKPYPGWLELPLTGTNFHGPKPVRSTEVLLGNTSIYNMDIAVSEASNVLEVFNEANLTFPNKAKE